VTDIDAHSVTLGTDRIAAATIVWSAGVSASPLVRTLDTPTDRSGRAIVEPDLSIPGHPEVFVVGDAAAFLHAPARSGSGANASNDPSRPRVPLPGVAQTAIQGAAHVARTIRRRLRGLPSTAFVYRDLGSMAIVGRLSAVADLGLIRLTGPLAWLAWLFLHIAMLIGFRNRASVLLQWAVAYLTYQRGARLITDR
jgi:NADH dehydrogenase